jgi:hypothetical protein
MSGIIVRQRTQNQAKQLRMNKWKGQANVIVVSTVKGCFDLHHSCAAHSERRGGNVAGNGTLPTVNYQFSAQIVQFTARCWFLSSEFNNLPTKDL